eukprot:790189-Pleurochrysis_carterae.AAC.2
MSRLVDAMLCGLKDGEWLENVLYKIDNSYKRQPQSIVSHGSFRLLTSEGWRSTLQQRALADWAPDQDSREVQRQQQQLRGFSLAQLTYLLGVDAALRPLRLQPLLQLAQRGAQVDVYLLSCLGFGGALACLIRAHAALQGVPFLLYSCTRLGGNFRPHALEPPLQLRLCRRRLVEPLLLLAHTPFERCHRLRSRCRRSLKEALRFGLLTRCEQLGLATLGHLAIVERRSPLVFLPSSFHLPRRCRLLARELRYPV